MSKDLWSQLKAKHKSFQKITTDSMQALPGQGRLMLYDFTKLTSPNLLPNDHFGIRMIKILPFCQPDYNDSLQNIDTNQFY